MTLISCLLPHCLHIGIWICLVDRPASTCQQAWSTPLAPSPILSRMWWTDTQIHQKQSTYEALSQWPESVKRILIYLPSHCPIVHETAGRSGWAQLSEYILYIVTEYCRVQTAHAHDRKQKNLEHAWVREWNNWSRSRLESYGSLDVNFGHTRLAKNLAIKWPMTLCFSCKVQCPRSFTLWSYSTMVPQYIGTAILLFWTIQDAAMVHCTQSILNVLCFCWSFICYLIGCLNLSRASQEAREMPLRAIALVGTGPGTWSCSTSSVLQVIHVMLSCHYMMILKDSVLRMVHKVRWALELGTHASLLMHDTFYHMTLCTSKLSNLEAWSLMLQTDDVYNTMLGLLTRGQWGIADIFKLERCVYYAFLCCFIMLT
jgi:hypothetical protein